MVIWQKTMAIAPPIVTGFRPNLSMYRSAGMVVKHNKIPTTPVAKRLVVLLEVPSAANIEGA